MSTIAYPYSSRLFRRTLARTTNARFGNEFIRSVNRLTDVVEMMSQDGNQENPISEVLMSVVDQQSIMGDAESIMQALSSKEIYLRVSQNIELVGLYA